MNAPPGTVCFFCLKTIATGFFGDSHDKILKIDGKRVVGFIFLVRISKICYLHIMYIPVWEGVRFDFLKWVETTTLVLLFTDHLYMVLSL